MIDLYAIEARCEEIDKLRKEHSWMWPDGVSEPIMVVLNDRKDMVAEVKHLRILLERAQRAEAATQEAVAREAALVYALEIVWKKREELYCEDRGDRGWSLDLDVQEGNIVRGTLRDKSAAADALLERLAELESQAADLRGSLQAALAPLEAAADALVPPGARVEEATDLVEEAIVVIREELEE